MKTKPDAIIFDLDGTLATEGILLEGVLPGLRALHKNYLLFIVSNCEAGYIEDFLKTNELEGFFTDHECWGNTTQAKAHNIDLVIRRNYLRSAIYVGDTHGDLIAARACDLPFYFVEYGFGQVKDADLRFASFRQLADHLLTYI